MPRQLEPVPRELTDDDLVAMFHQGHFEAVELLLERYRRFARAKARGYFLVGADFDDIEQEGMIGLFKAVRDFRPDRQSSFRAFAELCVTRQILTAIKTSTRHKHQPLNQYVSLSGVRSVEDPDERPIEEMLRDNQVVDPAEEIVSWECMAELTAAIAKMLSDLEVDVLRLYVEGRSYQEIGDLLGRHAKSIDNAIQRIKRKLEVHLQERRTEERAAAAVA